MFKIVFEFKELFIMYNHYLNEKTHNLTIAAKTLGINIFNPDCQ
ncbi:hypothetical protein WCLE_00160 [Wolbachia endosymbiont of Cimex lectularius]|nr:hypothetical protein WCLE_00160 [Wolbachia endosymbiont of Cimex lectularius]